MFKDVPRSYWASWYTDYAKEKGLLNGLYEKRRAVLRKQGKRVTEENLYFNPEEEITRAEAIRMMVNTYESIYGKIQVPEDYQTKMIDLKKTDSWYPWVSKAEYKGLVE